MGIFQEFQIFLLLHAGPGDEWPSAFCRAGSLRNVCVVLFAARRSALGDSELLSVSLSGSPGVAAAGARYSGQLLRMLPMGAEGARRAASARARRGARVSRPRPAGCLEMHLFGKMF